MLGVSRWRCSLAFQQRRQKPGLAATTTKKPAKRHIGLTTYSKYILEGAGVVTDRSDRYSVVEGHRRLDHPTPNPNAALGV
jgi:hypothetical protein